MPRSSNKQIEEDEHKIIQQLMEDSRQTPHEIAEKCGFSRQKVWRIMTRLDEGNRVWGYTAVIDDEKTGRNIYFALIKTKAPLFSLVEATLKKLTGKKRADELGINLLGIYYLNGLYDWILIYTAEDIRNAKKLLGLIQNEFGNDVDRIDFMQNVFPLIKFGKINPNIDQLKTFAIA